MKKIISILSIGYGRLHLVQSAEWLEKADVSVKLICGWVPKNPEGWLVRFCSKLIKRDLSPGMKKRSITLTNGGEVYPCPWADFLCNGLLWFDQKFFKKKFNDKITCWGWKIFGWQTQRYLKQFKKSGEAIFHVRSGAGQGGAIKVAKKSGIKVLVDHSALHPAQTEINLKDDYARWNESLPIAPEIGVWKNVLEDCAEADILLVNANHIRDSFIERGYDPKKVKVVYLGVREDFRDVTINRLKSGKKNEITRVLFTGSFYLLKGAEYLLESLRILNAHGVKVHYDVVGAVNVPKSLMEKYKGLPIRFHGPVPQDDLKRFLADSDIYLFPSMADGCAQSGMEALTAGLPVVTTYQSGLPITDGETGCLVVMKDAVSIAEKIKWLIAHPEERLRLGTNAAKMMRENYTWEQYADNVKKIYEELLGYG